MSLQKEIDRIMDLAVADPMPLSIKTIKLFEEGGELAEAVNHHLGYLPHKTMKEPLVGEVADIINVVLSIYVKAYPELSRKELHAQLLYHLDRKSNKWESVIKESK